MGLATKEPIESSILSNRGLLIFWVDEEAINLRDQTKQSNHERPHLFRG
ncbi:hypothetical protein BTN50_1059 [Candidatus Enterovibrio altilux]|uniref:Mobile element protein n=1 Tax=Candidatus Enterovibrio altilux TaxID=1927128 RepID=A0A291B974_9GAMM|nr:hypothetical protein BTN50_1059 [Candidatus Enterovibrio luxaltus]